jgi:hypothetical protein
MHLNGVATCITMLGIWRSIGGVCAKPGIYENLLKIALWMELGRCSRFLTPASMGRVQSWRKIKCFYVMKYIKIRDAELRRRMRS